MAMTDSCWQGALWLARDFCLVAGASGATRPHAHYAHQALLALDEPLRLLVDGQPVSGRVLLVESMCTHALEDASQPMVAVYAEPLAFSLDSLRDALGDARPDLGMLTERLHAAPRRLLDSRIARALEAVDELLAEKVSAAELARTACLSLSQLERLFGEQVGLSVRRLVLWRRLRLALALAMAGEPLTHAAHAAGFADAAHFSRTVRSTFGVRADRTLRNFQLRLLE
jgi:AraC-like DNA-binding protein